MEKIGTWPGRVRSELPVWLMAGLLGPGALACGTNPGPSPDADPVDPAAEPARPPEPACRAVDVHRSATSFAGERCPWTLRVRDGDGLELVSTDPEDDRTFAGPAPPSCAERPCSYRGRSTSAGPLVLVTTLAFESEMPAGVQLGFVSEGALRFVDLWEDGGPEVFDGGVSLGPAHALAPFDCGGALALRAASRTVAGDGVAPPPSLRARERMASDPGSPVPTHGCAPVSLELP